MKDNKKAQYRIVESGDCIKVEKKTKILGWYSFDETIFDDDDIGKIILFANLISTSIGFILLFIWDINMLYSYIIGNILCIYGTMFHNKLYFEYKKDAIRYIKNKMKEDMVEDIPIIKKITEYTLENNNLTIEEK